MATGLLIILLLASGCKRAADRPADDVRRDAQSSAGARGPSAQAPREAPPGPLALPPPPGPPPLPPGLKALGPSGPFASGPVEIPKTLGSLSLAPDGTNSQYRVTDRNDTNVNFFIPSSFLASVFRAEMMPESEKINGILAYPQMERARGAPPDLSMQMGPPVTHDPVDLRSETRGSVRIAVDEKDNRLARIEVQGVIYTMPAQPAFGMVSRPDMSPDQKLDALLSFPFIKKQERGAGVSTNSTP